jgi:peptidylprolyl isomerase
MKTHTLPLSALILALPLVAQTTPTPAVHTTTTTTHHTSATPGCAKLPEFSPKIPALPAGLPCAKHLYTLTRTPDTHLDYASPLISPEIREALSSEKTTYSLDYVDTKIGTGPLAQPGKFYTVHYTGYLADGTKFDSSVDRGDPITFPYGKHHVIQGWDTGFEGMHIGGKRRLYIPYQLAYGEAGRPPIPAKAELVFDVEFIAQGDEAPKPAAPPARRPVTPPPAPKPTTPPGGTGSDAPGMQTKPATPATPPPASSTPPPTTQPQQ